MNSVETSEDPLAVQTTQTESTLAIKPLTSLENLKQKDERAMSQHKRISAPGTVWHAAAFQRPGHLMTAASRELRFRKKVRKTVPLLENEVDPEELGEIKQYLEDCRGLEYSETLLHVACLFSNVEVADFLIKNCPILIDKQYKDIYAGETALHIAVVLADIDLIKILLGYPSPFPTTRILPSDNVENEKKQVIANVNARVTGDFFDVEKGQVFFGDHPLSFAVCLKSPKKKEILRILIEKGARLDCRDKRGNNLLHICVHNQDIEMYYYVADMFDLYKRTLLRDLNDRINKINFDEAEKAKAEGRKISPMRIKPVNSDDYDLEKITNYKDRTPLTLAIEMGKIDMVSAILKRRKHVLWTYGPVAAAAYPLREVDTFREKLSDPPTALQLLVYLGFQKAEDNNKRKEMLELTPFKEILDQKWRRFGFHGYLFFLFWHVVYLIFIAFAIIRPDAFLVDGQDGPFMDFCEVFVLFCAGAIWCREIVDIFTMRWAYLREPGTRPFRAINWISAALFYSAIPLRFTGYQFQEQMMVSVAGCLAFIYLLYYARGESHLGAYVVVLRRMIFKDFLQFLIIYFCFLFGFGLIFWSTFRTSGQKVLEDYPWTLLTLYRMSLFNFTGYDPTQSGQQALTITAFIFYTALTGIVMLNLLIAMMNESYNLIRKDSFYQWKLEWASIVLFIERRLPIWLIRRFDRLRVGRPGHSLGIPDSNYYLVVLEKIDWTSHDRKKDLLNIFRHAIHRVWFTIWKNKVREKTTEFVQKKKKVARENIHKALSQVRERLYIISILRNNKIASGDVDDVKAKELVNEYMEKYGKSADSDDESDDDTRDSDSDDEIGKEKGEKKKRVKTEAEKENDKALQEMVESFLRKQLVDEKRKS